MVIQMSTHNIYYYEEVDNITQTVIYKIVWLYYYRGMYGN